MNNLLNNIIKVRDVAVFINDVIVKIETKEGYDDIAKEVLRRIAENYLLVKPEKCVWKIRKVGFLGVVIVLDEVKIEKEKA